jgi:LysM repeat protein
MRTLPVAFAAIVWHFAVLTDAQTGDSLTYLTPKDTILLSVGPYGGKYFDHQLADGQTLYSLARFYGLSVQELYAFNPQLQARSISRGDPVRIPLPNRAILRFRAPEISPLTHAPVYYLVRKGDTMYRLSKRYFELPMDTLLARAGLQSHEELKPGQRIHIGWMNIKGIPPDMRSGLHTNPYAAANARMAQRFLRQLEQGKDAVLTKGAACWQKTSRDSEDFFAMHDTAPLQSIIEVKNPMNGLKVYVKVLCRIPDTLYDEGVEVVLSPTAARALGAINARFFVHVKSLR